MAATDSIQCFGRMKKAMAITYCKRGRGLIKINGGDRSHSIRSKKWVYDSHKELRPNVVQDHTWRRYSQRIYSESGEVAAQSFSVKELGLGLDIVLYQ